jgi:hypothetical protein
MGSKPNIIEPLAPLSTKQQVAAFLKVRRGRSIDFAATISAFHNQLAFRRHAALASTRTSQLGQQSQLAAVSRPRGSGTINNNSADNGVRGSENERREQCRAVFK